MKEILTQIVAQQPYPLLFATVSGAHLYGFPSVNSDYDLRGSHILPLPAVIGLDTPQETLQLSEQRETLELDLVTHDIHKFFKLLLKHNGYVLEQIYSPLVVHTTPEYEELKQIAQGCITRYHSHHYLGFARSQWRLFSKESVKRVKPLLYVYRVLLTGIYLLQTGEIEANLVTLNEQFQLTYLPDLITQKTSGQEQTPLKETEIAFYEQEYLRLLAVLESAESNSHLPQAPTAKPALQDLLLRLRMRHP